MQKVSNSLVCHLSLLTALSQLEQSIRNCVGTGKFRLVSFGDWPARYQLPLEAKFANVALPDFVSANFLNVLDLHYDMGISAGHPAPAVSTIVELLRANDLEPNEDKWRAKTDGASLVRILNRMIRTFKGRSTAGGLKPDGPSSLGVNNESTEESKTELVKRDRSRSRSRDRNSEQPNGKYNFARASFQYAATH